MKNIGIEEYSDYKFGGWKMSTPGNRNKYGKERMLKTGARTTTTSLTVKNQKTDMLRMYIDTDYVFICPWNGRLSHQE